MITMSSRTAIRQNHIYSLYRKLKVNSRALLFGMFGAMKN